jgi:hypothetical protein
MYCLFCVFLCIVFVCKRVLYYCHRVATQLQLTNISYHIYQYHIISYIMSHHISLYLISYIISYIISYVIYIISHHIYHFVMNKIPTRCSNSILFLFSFVLCSTCFGCHNHPSSGASTVRSGMVWQYKSFLGWAKRVPEPDQLGCISLESYSSNHDARKHATQISYRVSYRHIIYHIYQVIVAFRSFAIAPESPVCTSQNAVRLRNSVELLCVVTGRFKKHVKFTAWAAWREGMNASAETVLCWL